MNHKNSKLINELASNLRHNKLESSVKETVDTMSRYTPEQRNDIARYYDGDVVEKFVTILDRPLTLREKMYVAGNSYKVANATVTGKNFFNVPRPFVVTPSIGHIPVIGPESPSYPSGHAAGYSALHKMFSNIDPKNEPKYRSLRNHGAVSRIIAGVHTPIDIIGGFIVSDFVIQ